MPTLLEASPKAPAWLRPEPAPEDPVSLPDHYFEGHDILADGDTRDAESASFGAVHLICSPSQSRFEISMPLSPALGNAQSVPAIRTPRGRTRTGEDMPRSASKRRRSAIQSPRRPVEVVPDTEDIDQERIADASCAVFSLTASPKIESVISPPRRSPRLHASTAAVQSPATTRDAAPAFLSPSERRSMPAQHEASPGQSILRQLRQEQQAEEQGLQRLVTPKREICQSPGALGSSQRVIQALLSEEAEGAAALEQLLSPGKLHSAPNAAPGSASRATARDAGHSLRFPTPDEHKEVTRAGIHHIPCLTSSFPCMHSKVTWQMVGQDIEAVKIYRSSLRTT